MAHGQRLTDFLALLLVNLTITLLLLEGSLQYVKIYGPNSQNPLVSSLNNYIALDISWEEYFVYQYMDRGEMIYAGIHRYHPTRGWAMKPSVSNTGPDGISYTTNAQGYRALQNYSDQPDQFQVMVVGDSFTFGDDITDTDTWPYLLQKRNQSLNVIAIPGTGYGTDQMLVTLQEEIDKYHPDLVIAAYIGDNLHRSTLPFRDYKKPYFVLDDGKLVLHNIPVGPPAEVLAEISQKHYFSYSPVQTVNLFNYFTNKLTRMDGEPSCGTRCTELNTAIFEKMSELASQHNAKFMLIYLPFYNEITSPDGYQFGESFFDLYRASHQGEFLNPRTDLVEATFEKAPLHYRRNETSLLADLVMAKIRKMPSWQCKAKKHC